MTCTQVGSHDLVKPALQGNSFAGKTLQHTLRLESFPTAGNDRSRMRTKFGNELMLPPRPSSSSIDHKSSIVDCRLQLPPIPLGWALLHSPMPSIYDKHSFVKKKKKKKISVQSIDESVFHCFPLWRHEIKVPPDQIYCDASIAYLNEPTCRQYPPTLLFNRLMVRTLSL